MGLPEVSCLLRVCHVYGTPDLVRPRDLGVFYGPPSLGQSLPKALLSCNFFSEFESGLPLLRAGPVGWGREQRGFRTRPG